MQNKELLLLQQNGSFVIIYLAMSTTVCCVRIQTLQAVTKENQQDIPILYL